MQWIIIYYLKAVLNEQQLEALPNFLLWYFLFYSSKHKH